MNALLVSTCYFAVWGQLSNCCHRFEIEKYWISHACVNEINCLRTCHCSTVNWCLNKLQLSSCFAIKKRNVFHGPVKKNYTFSWAIFFAHFLGITTPRHNVKTRIYTWSHYHCMGYNKLQIIIPPWMKIWSSCPYLRKVINMGN